MSKLFLVPTPIGNLEDITFRAIDILKKVDTILAEDTRKTIILLNHYEIKKRLQSYHQFNEHKSIEKLIKRLKQGESMALVSDAGTPSISDPGFLIVKSCLDHQIPVECLPGPTAFIPALVNSGLPADRFCFEGFLPHKKGRTKRLKLLSEETRTMIFYESPQRLIRTLLQLSEYFGNTRNASISRELTKVFEETQRGTIGELIDFYNNKTIKGEIVIVVEGKKV